MTKLNNKGFFLAETIVVVGIVATVLVLFYSQISGFYRNYERNSYYNTVEAIHIVHNIKSYIEQGTPSNLVTSLNASGKPLIDITSYNFDAIGYYNSLIDNLNVKKVYFTQYNINSVIDNYNDYNIDINFLDYLKTLRVTENISGTYRIIVILNNGEYASVTIVIS